MADKVCTCHFQSPEVCEIHKSHLGEVAVAKTLLAWYTSPEQAEHMNNLIEAHVDAAVKQLKSELTNVFFPETQR